MHRGRRVRPIPIRPNPLQPQRGRRVRGAKNYTDLARALSGSIGLYHIVMNAFTAIALAIKWRSDLSTSKQKVLALSAEEFHNVLILPVAFEIATNIIFCLLGIGLFTGIWKRNRDMCESWLLATATVDFFVIIKSSQFKYNVAGIIWDIVKCIVEICVVWCFTMDLRKEEQGIPVPVIRANPDEEDAARGQSFESGEQFMASAPAEEARIAEELSRIQELN